MLVFETVPRRDAGPELTGTYLQRVSEANITARGRSATTCKSLAVQQSGWRLLIAAQAPNWPFFAASVCSSFGASQYCEPKRF